jgi:predicted aspartyl protease
VIEGTVNDHREAVVEITILGLADQRERVTCVVDTGYDGALTLPAEIASSLGLPSMGAGRSMLGDGSWTNYRSYEAFVRLEWHCTPSDRGRSGDDATARYGAPQRP